MRVLSVGNGKGAEERLGKVDQGGSRCRCAAAVAVASSRFARLILRETITPSASIPCRWNDCLKVDREQIHGHDHPSHRSLIITEKRDAFLP